MMDQNSVAVKGSLSWADSEALLRVRRQIDEGFLEPVTIAELSKQHFMCESKLREIFRKHYGITIYQYMLNRRMEHACELLSAPDARVKDIGLSICVALRLASRTVNSNALSILSLDDVALDYDGAIKTYTGSGTDLVIGMEGAALYASSPNALEVLLGEALAKTWANRYNKNTDIVL